MRFMVLAKRLRILRNFFFFEFFFCFVVEITDLLNFIDSTVFIEFSLTFIPIIEFIRIHFDSNTVPRCSHLIFMIGSAQKMEILFVEYNMIHFNDIAL